MGHALPGKSQGLTWVWRVVTSTIVLLMGSYPANHLVWQQDLPNKRQTCRPAGGCCTIADVLLQRNPHLLSITGLACEGQTWMYCSGSSIAQCLQQPTLTLLAADLLVPLHQHYL